MMIGLPFASATLLLPNHFLKAAVSVWLGLSTVLMIDSDLLRLFGGVGGGFFATVLTMRSANATRSLGFNLRFSPSLSTTHALTALKMRFTSLTAGFAFCCACAATVIKYGRYSSACTSAPDSRSANFLACNASGFPVFTKRLNSAIRLLYACGFITPCIPMWPPNSCRNTGTMLSAVMASATSVTCPFSAKPSMPFSA